ncbi:MAG: SDR family oxidoreductase [Actinomycetota bacterium]|nr:SDR family oxidoreductase [Actinomycetota bacterium]
MRLEGRSALVTGGASGIGAATVQRLAAEGARVAVSSRSRKRIEAAAAEVGAALAVAHDSADLDGVPALVERVEGDLGPIEILVTNTGGPPPGPEPLGFPREQWEEAYRTLVLFPLALVERVVPGMRERRWGRIVNVSSTSVREPIDGLMLSNAHRTGTLAAFKTISRSVARDGVTLNSVLTGRIATDRILDMAGSREAAEEAAAREVPAGRLGTVEEYAAMAAFLCSDAASYVTGAALPVDGGLLRSL